MSHEFDFSKVGAQEKRFIHRHQFSRQNIINFLQEIRARNFLIFCLNFLNTVFIRYLLP